MIVGLLEAVARLDARCRRAEDEYPDLAAPDGNVAVPIGDLRLVINAASAPPQFKITEDTTGIAGF